MAHTPRYIHLHPYPERDAVAIPVTFNGHKEPDRVFGWRYTDPRRSDPPTDGDTVPCYTDPTVCRFPNPCGDRCPDTPGGAGADQ